MGMGIGYHRPKRLFITRLKANSQIALRVASHFELSISVLKSPSEMVNLLLISSVAISKRVMSERLSVFLLLRSRSMLRGSISDSVAFAQQVAM